MKNTSPYWLVIPALIIIGLLWHIFNIKTDVKIEHKKSVIETSKNKIDSLESKQSSVIKSISEQSKKTVKDADILIKKLKNEQQKVNDTTYDYMCKYIQNYRTK